MGWLSSPSDVGWDWPTSCPSSARGQAGAGCLTRKALSQVTGSPPGVLSSSSPLAQVPRENGSTRPHEDEAQNWHTPFLPRGQRQSQDQPRLQSGETKSPWWEKRKSHFVKGLGVRRSRELGPCLQPTYHSYYLRYFPLKKVVTWWLKRVFH